MNERYEIYVTLSDGTTGVPIWWDGEESYPDEASARKAMNRLKKGNYSWSGCEVGVRPCVDGKSKCRKSSAS